MRLSNYEKTLIEEFREFFSNTGGNDVVELLERNVDIRINQPVAILQVACLGQLNLLLRLRQAGRI